MHQFAQILAEHRQTENWQWLQYITIILSSTILLKRDTLAVFYDQQHDNIEWELKNYDGILSNPMDSYNWFACTIQAKHLQIEKEKLFGYVSDTVRMYDEFYGNGELLYDSDNSIITSETENGWNIVRMNRNELNLSEMADSIPDEVLNDQHKQYCWWR